MTVRVLRRGFLVICVNIRPIQAWGPITGLTYDEAALYCIKEAWKKYLRDHKLDYTDCPIEGLFATECADSDGKAGSSKPGAALDSGGAASSGGAGAAAKAKASGSACENGGNGSGKAKKSKVDAALNKAAMPHVSRKKHAKGSDDEVDAHACSSKGGAKAMKIRHPKSEGS